MAAFRTTTAAARPMMRSVTRPVMGVCRPSSQVDSNFCPTSFAASRRHLSAWSFISRYLPWGSSEDKKADAPPSEETKAETPPSEEKAAETPPSEEKAAETPPSEDKAADTSPSDDKAADTSSNEEKTADASVLSSAQVDAVTASWDKVEALGAETVGVLLFKRIFEIAPEALQFFSFKDEPDLYESDALKKHGALVVTTVGKAVAGLKDLEKLAPVVRNLGKAHANKGIVAAHYDVVGQALIDTLETGLGEEAFTEEVKGAWLSVYGIVKATMLEGQAE